MIPPSKVSQCNIYHKSINIDHQNDDIINPNVNLHSSNDSVDFNLASSSKRKNFKSRNAECIE